MQNTIMEEWQNLMEFNGAYKISTLGRIKSVRRLSNNRLGVIVLKEKILKNQINSHGYPIIGLRLNKKHITKTIHILVAKAFIPNPFNYKEVNHKNGIKFDNSITNLEWCSPSMNTRHAHANGLVKYNYGKDHWKSKIVIRIDKSGNISEYESTIQASKDGFASSMISRACNGKLKTGNIYKGYQWKYL